MKHARLTGIALTTALTSLALPALAQGAPDLSEPDVVTTLTRMVNVTGILVSLVVIAAAWLLRQFVRRLAGNLGDVFVERRLTIQKFTAFFQFGLYLLTIVAVVLLSFRFSREVLAILGGTAAVAIGFAVKDLVASMVAGIMIMFDRPFQVGDRVTFGGQYGDITAIGLRSVKLQTLDDNTVTIPNNMLLNDITSCGNYGVLDMQVVVDFHIGVDQDVHKAQELVREAAATSPYVYLDKPIVVRVSQVIVQNYFALRVRLKLYVLDTKFERALETDVTLRVLEAFDENGIRPPAILYRAAGDLAPPDRRALRLASQSA